MQSANRVFFNTIIQYFQLALNVLIGFISVRLILSALGEVDYGIYDLIGGVIGFLAFIKGALSQASMRFISIRIGEGSVERVRNTFSSCFWLHLFIALLLSAVIEFVGLFIFDGFLNIPEERLTAAHIVYHCATLTLFLNILVSPFLALLYANEQFWYSAVIEILNSILKLLVAIIITHYFSEKLVVYALLLLLITVFDFALNIIYTLMRFRRCVSITSPGMNEIKGLSGFIGWTLLDSFASIAQRQGYAILLNRFFGPVINTAYAISKQVDNHLYTVSSSAIATMKPQIIKSYGAGDETRMFRLSMTAGKIGFALMSMISIPFIVMMPDLLSLWLKSFPEETVLFTRLLLISCMVEQITRGLVFANQSVGNIKWFSIIISAIRVTALPLAWLSLHLGFPPYSAIVVLLLCEVVASFGRVFILSRISNFNRKPFWTQVILKIIPSVILSVAICGGLYYILPHSWLWLLFILVCNATVYGCSVYFIGMTYEEKKSIVEIFKSLKAKLALMSK